MIDNPTTVARLLEQMHEHLPIPAFPTKEIVRTLRRGGVQATADRPPTVQYPVYPGCQARIACDVTPTRHPKTVVLLTRVEHRLYREAAIRAPLPSATSK